MKRIKLTRGKFAVVDDEDFEFLNQWKWHLDAHGYARRSFKLTGKQQAIAIHTQIMNTPSGKVVDHINGNVLDNRRINLRICSRSQNAMNRHETVTNTSGYKGVYAIIGSKANPWAAKIQVGGKSVYLGLFATARDAATAYNMAASYYHGEYAKFKRV